MLDKHLIEGADNLNLIINKEFDELYGILSTFKIIANYNYFKIQAEEKWNMSLDFDIERDVKKISENTLFNDARYYLDMELQTKNIFINPDIIHISKDLDEYFNYLINQDEVDLKREILKALELDELIKYDFILREKGSGSRELFDSTMLIHNIKIKPIGESISTRAIIQSVITGLGLSVVPYLLVKGDIEKGNIHLINIKEVAFNRDFYIIHHKNKYLSDLAIDFLSICQKEGKNRKEDGEKENNIGQTLLIE